MKKSEYKFSIVIPCYNVEKYLSNTLESVFAQNYKNYEVVIVEDCSLDNTRAICDEFDVKYEFIKVIHNEINKGISESRNVGFANISKDSDYVFFMDSDDRIDEYLFEKVNESLKNDPAQIVVYGLTEDYYDKDDNFLREITVAFPKAKALKEKEEVRREIISIEERTLYGYVWNKFYSVSYLRSINAKFTPVTLIEDIKFNVEVFQDAESVNLLDITPYHYKKRSDAAGSLTSRFVPEYYEVSRRRVELVYNQLLSWGMLGDEEKRILGKIYVRYIFSAIQRNCDERAHMTSLDRYRWVRKLYSDTLFLDLIDYAKTSNKIISIMILLIKNRLSISCLLVGRLIHFVKVKLPNIFSKVKQNR